MARTFGVRYLWIDSLCIIQDSVEDWRKESAAMGQIYRNSLCSIGATGSKNSQGGLFFRKNPSAVEPISITVRWNGFPAKSYRLEDLDFWPTRLLDAPLNQRAWVVQERLLAPRMIHFGADQILWECHELDACETYPDGVPSALDQWCSNSKGLDPDIDGARFGSKWCSSNSALHACYLWIQVVEFYSRCKLTRGSDKLIALSGVASHIQKLMDDKYVAGLWRGNLTSLLLWRVSYRRLGELIERPGDYYRAPSLSWASLDAPVRWQAPNLEGSLLDIIDVKLQPLAGNPFGELKTGHMDIRGFLCTAELLAGEKEAGFSCSMRFSFWGHTFETDMADIDVTIDLDTATPKVLCLLVEKGTDHGVIDFTGLILRHTEREERVYARVGIFLLWNEPAVELSVRRDALRPREI